MSKELPNRPDIRPISSLRRRTARIAAGVVATAGVGLGGVAVDQAIEGDYGAATVLSVATLYVEIAASVMLMGEWGVEKRREEALLAQRNLYRFFGNVGGIRYRQLQHEEDARRALGIDDPPTPPSE